jgi:hypothetical protein
MVVTLRVVLSLLILSTFLVANESRAQSECNSETLKASYEKYLANIGAKDAVVTVETDETTKGYRALGVFKYGKLEQVNAQTLLFDEKCDAVQDSSTNYNLSKAIESYLKDLVTNPNKVAPVCCNEQSFVAGGGVYMGSSNGNSAPGYLMIFNFTSAPTGNSAVRGNLRLEFGQAFHTEPINSNGMHTLIGAGRAHIVTNKIAYRWAMEVSPNTDQGSMFGNFGHRIFKTKNGRHDLVAFFLVQGMNDRIEHVDGIGQIGVDVSTFHRIGERVNVETSTNYSHLDLAIIRTHASPLYSEYDQINEGTGRYWHTEANVRIDLGAKRNHAIDIKAKYENKSYDRYDLISGQHSLNKNSGLYLLVGYSFVNRPPNK